MPINFPTSPTLNQTYTYEGKTWRWNGTAWDIVQTSLNYNTVVNGLGYIPLPADSAASIIPVGVVLPYAGTSAPSGFLLCAGQEVSRTLYGSLFAAIGTTYGAGDGSNTFNLPDLRGRVPAGKDDMEGVAASRLTANVAGSTLGATGGAQSHTMTVAEMPAHDHAVNYTTALRTTTGSTTVSSISSGGSVSAANAAITTGGSGGHNNVQPTIVLNYIIKA